MPQFDFANFVPQLAWLAIFFAILYFGIVQLTLPKVGKVMTAREDKVSGDLATAETAKAEADRIGEDYAAGIAAAQDQARARLAEARSGVARSVEAKLAAANAEFERKHEAAEAELNKARAAALGKVEALAAELAGDIVERLTGNRPDDGETTRVAKRAMVEA